MGRTSLRSAVTRSNLSIKKPLAKMTLEETQQLEELVLDEVVAPIPDGKKKAKKSRKGKKKSATKKRRAAKKSKKSRKSKKGKRLTCRVVVAALRKLKGAVTYKALAAFLKKAGYKTRGLKKALRSLIKAKVVKAAKGNFSLTGKALKKSKKSKKTRKARKAKKAKKSKKA